MHELVLVLSDLYLSQEGPERELPEGIALPGIHHLTRFGTRVKLPDGWRPWLSHWLTGHDVGAPATVANLVRASVVAATNQADRGAVWLATPVHLQAGMTSVHLDRRGLLRLSADDSSALAEDFARVFNDTGFTLQPLETGEFLLFGSELEVTTTVEPARLMGGDMADAQPSRISNTKLRRLGAEIEMWLHDHPLNATRRRRGELAVTGLWIWGGGPTATSAAAAPATAGEFAFGRDAFLQGLWTGHREPVRALPQEIGEVFGYALAQRVVLVIEIASMLHSNSSWTFFNALAEIDRTLIAPAVAALNQSGFKKLVLIANDQQLTLKASDRFKFWRSTPPGLAGLQ